jgi:hypothetical protein
VYYSVRDSQAPWAFGSKDSISTLMLAGFHCPFTYILPPVTRSSANDMVRHDALRRADQVSRLHIDRGSLGSMSTHTACAKMNLQLATKENV